MELTSVEYEKIIVGLVILAALFVFAWTLACKEITELKSTIGRLIKTNFDLSLANSDKSSGIIIHPSSVQAKVFYEDEMKPVKTAFEITKDAATVDIDKPHKRLRSPISMSVSTWAERNRIRNPEALERIKNRNENIKKEM